MKVTIFRLIINAVTCAFAFGVWQNNIYAGLWLFLAIGTVYSCIDYVRNGIEA